MQGEFADDLSEWCNSGPCYRTKNELCRPVHWRLAMCTGWVGRAVERHRYVSTPPTDPNERRLPARL